MNFKNYVAAAIAAAANLDSASTAKKGGGEAGFCAAKTTEEIYPAIEIPPDSRLGDFAFPCFRLAKELKKAPPVIAAELASAIPQSDVIAEVRATGPYLNFFLNRACYNAVILGKVRDEGGDYGRSDMGGGRLVAIDYSAPNVAKPFHIGHMRSTNIGAALYKIYNHLGYKSYGINFLGDWGTQFGKIITAYKLWGNEDDVNRDGMEALLALYVKFHAEAKENPTLNDEARNWFLKMEQGDESVLALWKWFLDISMANYEVIYARLGNVVFDSYKGESFYNDKMRPIVDELMQKGLLTESDGARIVDLEPYKMPPCLILRSDGGTLYPTRDIASAKYRKQEYDFVKAIYITGQEQILHFAQWFKVVELMGYEWANDLVHVPFGLLSFGEDRLSTREGKVLRMSDLLDRAVNKISEIIELKNPALPNKELVAEQVGIGAVKFADLYNNRIKDVEFNWDRMLNFDGETGPYVQYTHARCSSVIAKAAGFDFSQADFSHLTNDDEFALAKALAAYPDKIIEAADKYEPYIIARHIMQVAQAYNKFYHDNPILRADDNIKSARLGLTECVMTVIASGLTLLGIAAPAEM